MPKSMGSQKGLLPGESAWSDALSSRWSGTRGDPTFGRMFPPAYRVFRKNNTKTMGGPKFVLEDYRQRIPLGSHGAWTWIPPRPELHLRSMYGSDWKTTVRFHRRGDSAMYQEAGPEEENSTKKDYAAVIAQLSEEEFWGAHLKPSGPLLKEFN